MMKKMGALTLSLALGACYVVPADRVRVARVEHGGAAGSSLQLPGAVSLPAAYTARLYPANKLAERYGVGNASVSAKDGYGVFNAQIGGDTFTGEASRDSADANRGTANGSSGRGVYLSCTYSVVDGNNGKGNCKTSDGALFDMHITH